MPVGRNSVYGPARAPVYDPAPIHGKRKVYVTGGFDLPPFHESGFVVNELSPGYPAPVALVLRSATVTLRVAAGSVTFVINVNGVPTESRTVAAAGLTKFALAVLLAPGDVVTSEVIGTSGSPQDFLVVLRAETVVSDCLGDGWCSASDTGSPSGCDHWTAWTQNTGFYTDGIGFTEGSNPYSTDLGLVVECAEASFPTPPFQVGSMIRTSAMSNNGIGQAIFVGLDLVYQRMGDAANFRCFVEISNYVDPGTGRRRCASFRVDSATPSIQVATYGYTAGGVQVDFDSATISPTIPTPDLGQVTVELDSYAGTQVVLVNGGTALVSSPGTVIGESGGYQSIEMWWDVQFGSCGAFSPVITSVTGLELC